jgi:hypothetical protein
MRTQTMATQKQYDFSTDTSESLIAILSHKQAEVSPWIDAVRAELSKRGVMLRPAGWKERAKTGIPSAEDLVFNAWHQEQQKAYIDTWVDIGR